MSNPDPASNPLALRPLEPSPVAHQQAPTLMGGLEPGSQGQVRVWSPDTRKPWLLTAYWTVVALFSGIVSLLMLIFGMPLHGMDLVAILCGAVLPATFAYGGFRALRKTAYFTTDDAGIGISLWKRGLPLRWDQVVSASLAFRQLRLTALTDDGLQHVVVELNGYRKSTRQELFRTIVEQAGLVPGREAVLGEALTPLEKYLLRFQYVRGGPDFPALFARVKAEQQTRGFQYHFGPGDRAAQYYLGALVTVANRIIRFRAARAALPPGPDSPALPEADPPPESRNPLALESSHLAPIDRNERKAARGHDHRARDDR